jgi:hypothetical protein
MNARRVVAPRRVETMRQFANELDTAAVRLRDEGRAREEIDVSILAAGVRRIARRLLPVRPADDWRSGWVLPAGTSPAQLAAVVAQWRTDYDVIEPFLTADERARTTRPLRRTERRLGIFGATRPAGNQSDDLRRIRNAIEDVTSYPLLTSDGAPPAPGGQGGGAGTGGFQRTIDAAIRGTLGRLPRYTDSTSFVAALTASFELTETQGHTAAVWRPRSYIGQTELGGGVSGFQASLYARARDSLAAVLPIIRTITPLMAAPDEQELDAARGMVEAEFTAVVNELGTEGGPRRGRVDELFKILLDNQVTGVDGAPVHNGVVGYFQKVFGLDAAQVNTIDEEQTYSSFLLMRDHITTVKTSWDSFLTQSPGDLGTGLVLLSNALQVVGESVEEVEAALDSVFVDSAERSVAQFETEGGRSMLVSELLGWITSFATQEARDLIQQAGRRAMGAVTSTADNLDELVARLIDAVEEKRPGLPVAMRHPRVLPPLRELDGYLDRVADLADQIGTTP